MTRHVTAVLIIFASLSHAGGVEAQGMRMPSDPLGVSMDRMGSGTTWIAENGAIPSKSMMAGDWMLLMHGFVFAQYDTQGGPRGDSQVGSLNWGMFMASRGLAGGRFQGRAMLSLDALTVGKRGYPLLLQSGESVDDEPIHDRQHPHDFFMELGALYERPVSKSVAVELYGAISGEPALGPVAFMHRPSAMDNPFANIGHHWQDATHISFGVVTAGVFTDKIKLEGSAFNGREPDENRWDIDRMRLDSYSGRLTVNPSSEWSFTAGYGWMKSPEAHEPDMSMQRATGSIMRAQKHGAEGLMTATFVYGANRMEGESSFSHSALIEAEDIRGRHNTFLMRAEVVQKSADELVTGIVPPDARFTVGAFSVGYIRELAEMRGATIGLGAMGTLNFVGSELETLYGSRMPKGAAVFLRMRPAYAKPAVHDMGNMKM